MRTRRFQFACALALFGLLGLAAQPGFAQRGVGQGRGKGQRPRAENRTPGGERRGPPPREETNRNLQRGMRRALDLPPRWMQRLQEMAPGEQERFLNNNERFRSLPPERQAQIRRRLQQWNSLSPEQQRAVRQRERIWEQMTPEQRRRVREEILPQWQQLPLERRQAILRRLRALRDLNDSERTAKLNDPAFLTGLSPEDQTLLRQLSDLRVGLPSEPPQEPPQE
jgi:predicted Fe-S protein YdhL (DUF1289 family)